MAKGERSLSEMEQARQSDGINVIFDQNSPASSRSRSRSSGSNRYMARGDRRVCYRSPSSSSSRSRSASRPRSRSHPRCNRPSSRCRCDNHRRYGRGRHRRSPPRRFRAHSRSYSRSPLPDRYSRRKSRSRSSNRLSRHRRTVSRPRSRISPPPSRSCRSRSRSRSSASSLSLSLDDKRKLLCVAKANATKILGVENVKLPESVKPILLSERLSPEPETWVRLDPGKTESQSHEVEPDDASNPKMSPKRKIISFSINNSVAKPTAVAPSSATVTPRVDSYESRRPYGHWVPVKSSRSSKARKHTLTLSHVKEIIERK